MGRTVELPTNLPSLRILGPSNGGVGTCIAGVRVLKIGTFEGSGYLGIQINQMYPLVFPNIAGWKIHHFQWGNIWTQSGAAMLVDPGSCM